MAGTLIRTAQSAVNWYWHKRYSSSNTQVALASPTGVGIRSTGWDAAGYNRRLSTWGPGTSLDSAALVAIDGAMLRRRCRDLVRNNPWASAACECFEANLIGLGIKPWWGDLPIAIRKELSLEWQAWTNEADPSGRNNFYGLQALVARHWFSDGEIFIRLVTRRAKDTTTVPLQLQLIETDQLDLFYDETLTNGNRIRSGIEFNARGERVAYHFWKTHPGDISGFNGGYGQRERIPADQILHFFHPLWASMIRGVPVLAPAALKAHDVQMYDEAEGERKKLSSSLLGWMRRDITLAEMSGGQTPAKDANGNPIDGVVNEIMDPGTFPVLEPGEEPVFPQFPDSGDYDRYIPWQMRAMAAPTMNTYEGLTGDQSQASYSSARVSMINLSRKLAAAQNHRFIHTICRPVIDKWLSLHSLRVELPGYDDDEESKKYHRAQWVAHGPDWIDPDKQAKGAVLSVKAGLSSRTMELLKRGLNPDEIDAQQAEDNERAEFFNVRYDTDTSIKAVQERNSQNNKNNEKEDDNEDEDEDDRVVPFGRENRNA